MRSFGNTDRGLVRELNEDDLYYSAGQVGALPNLYIVADGMGGHNAGEVASRNCIRYLVEYIAEADFDEDIEQLFYDAIAYANDKVYREGQLRALSDRCCNTHISTLRAESDPSILTR